MREGKQHQTAPHPMPVPDFVEIQQPMLYLNMISLSIYWAAKNEWGGGGALLVLSGEEHNPLTSDMASTALLSQPLMRTCCTFANGALNLPHFGCRVGFCL